MFAHWYFVCTKALKSVASVTCKSQQTLLKHAPTHQNFPLATVAIRHCKYILWVCMLSVFVFSKFSCEYWCDSNHVTLGYQSSYDWKCGRVCFCVCVCLPEYVCIKSYVLEDRVLREAFMYSHRPIPRPFTARVWPQWDRERPQPFISGPRVNATQPPSWLLFTSWWQ